MIIEMHKTDLEDLIRHRMANGEFQSVEDVDQLAASVQKTRMPLGQFLLESPLRDSGLKLERQRD